MPGDGLGGFASVGADPDEAERRIAQWAQGFADKAQRYQDMREKTEQIRLTAASPDGRVRVTVRSDGSVADLILTDKIRTMPPAELSAQILATMHKAQGDIATKVGEVMSEQLGDEDIQTRSLMLDNLRERFPEQPDEPEAEAAPSKWDVPDEAEPDQGTPPPAGAARATPPQAAPPQAGPAQQPGPAPESSARKPPRRGPDGPDEGDFDDDFDPLRD